MEKSGQKLARVLHAMCSPTYRGTPPCSAARCANRGRGKGFGPKNDGETGNRRPIKRVPLEAQLGQGLKEGGGFTRPH